MKNVILKSLRLPVFAFFLGAAVLTSSCGGDNAGTEDTIPEGMQKVDLEQYGLKLTILVPDSTKIGQPLETSAAPDGGVLVKRGKDFHIWINGASEDEQKIDLQKKMIEEDMIKKVTWHVNEPTALLYEQKIPDVEPAEYHIFVLHDISGNKYTVKDAAMIENEVYSKAGAEMMLASAKTLKGKEAKQEEKAE